MRGGVCHAPAAATRTDAPTAARERDEQVVATRVAVTPSETRRKVAASEVCAKLLLDVAGQPTFVVLAGVGEERFEIRADKLVQHRLGGAARRVSGCERGHGERARQSAARAIGRPEQSRTVAPPTRWPRTVFGCPRTGGVRAACLRRGGRRRTRTTTRPTRRRGARAHRGGGGPRDRRRHRARERCLEPHLGSAAAAGHLEQLGPQA